MFEGDPSTLDTDTMSTREVFELADGMRHWWNDDNPDERQHEHYVALGVLGEIVAVTGRLDEDHLERIQTFERYISDLEECVHALYQRYEQGDIAEVSKEEEPLACLYCGVEAINHWCASGEQTYE